jgi:uncharacterized membrane protein
LFLPVAFSPPFCALRGRDGTPDSGREDRHVRKHMKRLITPLVVAAYLATPDIVRAAAWSYTPSDIPPFAPLGLTDVGQVTGSYAGQPAIWQDGQMTLLPLLPGTVYGWVRSGNSLGHLVGACRSLETNGTYASHACVWTNGVVRALAEVPGTAESSAWSINDAGIIAGNVYSGTNGSFREAVVWNGTSVAKLLPPVAGSQSWARAINNSGQIAVAWTWPGAYYDSWFDYWAGNHAARWTPDVPNGTNGTMTTLTTLHKYGGARDINDAGIVCGDSYFESSSMTPAKWDGSTEIIIDCPYEGWWPYGRATGINNAGDVVGVAGDPDQYETAWIWSGFYGTRDLNLILNSTSVHGYPGNLTEALAINDAGQILVKTYGSYYVLLTPSEPPALSIQGTTTNTVVVSWPSISTGLFLQQNTNALSSNTWSYVTTGIEDDGTNKTLIVNPTDGRRFYRLFQP